MNRSHMTLHVFHIEKLPITYNADGFVRTTRKKQAEIDHNACPIVIRQQARLQFETMD